MIARTRIRKAALLGVIASLVVSLSACSSRSEPVFESPGGAAADATGTVTPLERGKIRRDVLVHIRGFLAAWEASDADGMEEYAAETVVAPFRESWEARGQEGLQTVHVREELYLDVTQLNTAATEALAMYRYDDDSFVADSSGAQVEALPVIRDKEMQFTLARDGDGDEWTIIRIITGQDAYR